MQIDNFCLRGALEIANDGRREVVRGGVFDGAFWVSGVWGRGRGRRFVEWVMRCGWMVRVSPRAS
jgi:hypothetical protein